MKASTEFVKGNHKIGYIESSFTSEFRDTEFNSKSIPTFQKLPRRMNDAEIETELKPGLCELGDLLSFLDNSPEECKDGNWNLFYFKAFVVHVHWNSDVGEWSVGTWGRVDDRWPSGDRVFSPATDISVTSPSVPSTLKRSDPKNSNKISVSDLAEDCLIYLDNGLILKYIGNIDILKNGGHLFKTEYSPFATTKWIEMTDKKVYDMKIIHLIK